MLYKKPQKFYFENVLTMLNAHSLTTNIIFNKETTLMTKSKEDIAVQNSVSTKPIFVSKSAICCNKSK